MTSYKRFVSAVDNLVSVIPKISKSFGTNNERMLAGWDETISHLHAAKARREPPCVVTVLYGPSGAGKSTLFRQITNLPVPVGATRPYSFGSIAAIPKFDEPANWLQTVFPDHDLESLDPSESELDRLHQQNGRHARSHLFYSRSAKLPADNGFIPAVVDLPDFNTIVRENADRARQLVARAEQVIFVVSAESYADKEVTNALLQVVETAATLLLVITKVESVESGEEIHKHLLTHLLSKSQFRTNRADNVTTYRDFVAAAPAYLALYRAKGESEVRIVPAKPTFAGFEQRLWGKDAEQLLTQSLVQPAYRLASEVLIRIEGVDHECGQIRDYLESVESGIENAARAASTHFPVSRFLELVAEEQEKHKSWLIGNIATGARRIFELARQSRSWIWSAIWGNQISDESKERAKRENVERESLITEVDQLLNKCRHRWPLVVDEQSCSLVVAYVREFSIPAPQNDWEPAVKRALANWGRDNDSWIWWSNLSADLLAIAGVGLIAADVMIAGGFVGTLGVLVAGGAGNLAAAAFIKWVKEWGLDKAAIEAQEEWIKHRSRELRGFLDAAIFEHLFREWRDKVSTSTQKTIRVCREACQEIVTLSTVEATNVIA